MTSEILSIPTSTFSFFLVPYLESSDFVSLRTVSKKHYDLIQSDAADEVWKQALIRDFSFDEEKANDNDTIDEDDVTRQEKFRSKKLLETLRLIDQNKSSACKSKEKPLSIFGSSMSEAVFTASSFYESWKHWKKASHRYFHISSGKKDKISKVLPQRNIHGPYFLRAARMWARVEKWCDDPESGSVGDSIKATLLPGLRWEATVLPSVNRNFNSLEALTVQAYEAIYAFCGGQATPPHEGSNLYGLFGGYRAYNIMNCTYLHDASQVDFSDGNNLLQLPIALSDGPNYANKSFFLNPHNGQLIVSLPGPIYYPAINIGYLQKHGSPTSRKEHFRDALLIWFEEYCKRLSNSYITLGKIRNEESDDAIVHYPTLRANETIQYPNGVQLTSRAVTRGVEVVASAILALEINAFIYSFRIRLLNKSDEDYASASERGFETCQLMSRHWKIHDYESKKIDAVDGDGVIGFYPLLSEGYYRNDHQSWDGRRISVGEVTAGIFQYQSCSRPPTQGHFEGHLLFVPGTINEPTGNPFSVNVAPFALDKSVKFVY